MYPLTLVRPAGVSLALVLLLGLAFPVTPAAAQPNRTTETLPPPSPPTREERRPISPPPAATPPGPAVPTPPAAPAGGSPEGGPLPQAVQAPLRLDQLLDLARTRNPEWAAALAGPRAAEGELIQAGMTPNPTVAVRSVVELPSRLEAAGLSVSQEIELGGKRQARIAAATARLEAARHRAREVERQLRLQLRTAYADLLYAQQLQAMRDDALRLAEESLRLTRGRLKAGDVAGVDVMQLEVEVARRRSELEEATGRVISARTVLSRLFGEPAANEFAVTGDLGLVDSLPELPALQQLAATRPDLLQSNAEAEAAEREIEVQRTRGISNLTASLGLARERLYIDEEAISPPGVIHSIDESSWAATLQLSIPLPINDTNEGNIIRAQALAQGAQLSRQAAGLRVQAEVAQAFAEVQAARRSLAPLEETALERARQALDITDQAYRLGQRSLLNVLQSRQEYLQLRLARLDAQRSLELALARLEAAIGNPIGGVQP